MSGVKVGALKKMLPKQYKHRGLIVHEVFNVVSHYKCLTPMMGTYVFNDGVTQHLMSLVGTVPACFIGKEINIPVCLWLLKSYPRDPPVCFVKPTQDMLIVPGQYIDANGQIALPYLQDWSYPQCDLYGLIQVLTVVFGEEPPICARPPPKAMPPIFQGDWDFQTSKPESWEKAEVISSSDKEMHFALAREDGASVPSDTEC